MLSPGKNRPKACLPRVTMICGETIAICDSRYLEQECISSGMGSRLSGGLHLTILVMKISDLVSEILSRSESRSLPAAPTNGTPCWSSLYPGASPKKNNLASEDPSPGTERDRDMPSGQLWQLATASAKIERDLKGGDIMKGALDYEWLLTSFVRV